jgi:ligand-binding sensor domain-containing protein
MTRPNTSTVPVTALNPRTTLRFHHLTVDNGLPSNRITALHQTSRGFMWFCHLQP